MGKRITVLDNGYTSKMNPVKRKVKTPKYAVLPSGI